MIYELAFHPEALKEWVNLDPSVRTQFKKKLAERQLNPRVPAAQLSGRSNRYKIKLRTVGYRLVYEVRRDGDGRTDGRKEMPTLLRRNLLQPLCRNCASPALPVHKGLSSAG